MLRNSGGWFAADREPGKMAVAGSTKKIYRFKVEGVDCASCADGACERLRTAEGVAGADFNLIESVVSVIPESAVVTEEQLKRNVRDSGFKLVDVEGARRKGKDGGNEAVGAPVGFIQRNSMSVSMVSSGIFLLSAYIYDAVTDRNDSVQYLLYSLCIAAGSLLLIPKALRSLRHLNLDMDVLMLVAIAGAVAIGEWHEAAMVVFLFSVAHFLEGYSMDRARRAIEKLMNLAPPTALVRTESGERRIDVEEVEVGDIFIIKPGDRIPLDGEVVSGVTEVDQSAITGESMPVAKEAGEIVYAGTMNGRGSLEVKTTKRSTETTLSNIKNLITEGRAEKAGSEKFIDRFARYYTPAVIGIAVIVAVVPPLVFGGSFSEWFYRALVILIISCPCALVISTPVAIVTALSSAARNGVLVKGGKYLEAISGIKVMAFDKTGTLTHGQPEVTEIIPAAGKTEFQVMEAAAAVDCMSEHHIGRAIVEKAAEMGIAYTRADAFESMAGRGARGVVNGIECYIGNHRMAEEKGYCSGPLCGKIQELEREGRTVIVVGGNMNPIGCLVVEDEIRNNSRDVVAALKAAGIRETVMLTGDNPWTGRRIGDLLGIEKVSAGLMPGDKLEAVKKLLEKHGSLAMVGDGVNDAPALAASTVGIAMGRAGSDVTLETADVTLMSDDLSRLPYLVRLGKRTVSIIRQNVLLALGLKAAFLCAAAAGVATLWMAVIADTGASLIVTMNSLRLIRAEKTRGLLPSPASDKIHY